MPTARSLPDQCTLEDVAGNDANISAAARVTNIWNQRNFTLMEPDRRALWNYIKSGAWRRGGQALRTDSIEGWTFWRDFYNQRAREVDYDKCTIARWLILVAVNKGIKGIPRDVRKVIKDRYGEQAVTMFAGPVSTNRRLTPVDSLWNENPTEGGQHVQPKPPTAGSGELAPPHPVSLVNPNPFATTSIFGSIGSAINGNAQTFSAPSIFAGIKLESSGNTPSGTQSSQALPKSEPVAPKKRKWEQGDIETKFTFGGSAPFRFS